MRTILKVLVVLGATAIYLAALHFLAPTEQPYYLIGIFIVGLCSWLLGAVAGMVVAVLLIPITGAVYGDYAVVHDFMVMADSPPYIAMEVLASVSLGILRNRKSTIAKKEAQLADANDRLQDALSKVQELGGVHSFCGTCKKIKDDSGDWKNPDAFLMDHTKMEFSHCLCPECAEEYGKSSNRMSA